MPHPPATLKHVSRSLRRRKATAALTDEALDANLDEHAGPPPIHTSPRTEHREPKRARESPWERYLSDAKHSYPDYGSKEERMTSKRLVVHAFGLTVEVVAETSQRSINGQSGPVNTLNRQTHYDSVPWDASPPSKRQRPNASDTILSFTGRGSGSSDRRSQVHVEDLTKSSSHDGHDVWSISSAGKVPSTAAALPEFRHAQTYGRSSKPRQRKSRQSLSQTGLQAKGHDTTTPTHFGDRSDLDSPDVLAIEDHPAPSRVVSDLLLSRKAVRPHQAMDRSGPAVKRANPAKGVLESIQSSDESLDDLSNDKEPVQLPSKKPTNFDGVASTSSQKRVSSRGDIQQTTFQRPQRTTAGSRAALPDMTLRRAACGKAFYDPEGQSDRVVRLVEDGKDAQTLVPVTDNGKRAAQPWLAINMATVQKVFHASTHSSCVIVERPGNNIHPGKAFLEFKNLEAAMAFVRAVPTDRTIEREIAYLESGVRNALKQAEGYRESCPRDQAESATKHQQAPWASKPVSTEDGGGGATSRPKSGAEPQRLTRSMGPPNALDDVDMSTQGTTLGTRRTRRTSPKRFYREPTPERWTTNHPEWRERWQRSLVYPATGKNRATVDDEDIPRLDEGEFLNDNLISFYIRYLQATLERESPQVLKKVHIFSTFFFEKLRSTKGRINYDGVKAWTAKIDLFSYDYIVVPVNEHAHWYLAIICNVPNAIQGVPEDDDVEMIDDPRKPHDKDPRSTPPPSSRTLQSSPGGKRLDPRQPRIVTLDSLESPHSPTCRALKEYLIEEARDKKNIELAVVPSGMSAKKIPCQNNYCDCGVYVLGYLKEFLKDPDEVARKLLQREDLDWDIQPAQLRENVRKLLFDLQEAQSKRLEEEKQEKRAALQKKKAAKKGQQEADQPDNPSALKASLPESSSVESMASSAASAASAKSGQSAAKEPETAGSAGDRTPGTREAIEDEPALIGRLSSRSTSSSTSSAFYSAQESPDGMPPSVAKLPKTTAVEKEKKAPPTNHDTIDIEDDVQLIQPLSSSSDSKEQAHAAREHRLKRARQPSIELAKKPAMQTYGGASRGRKQTSELSAFFNRPISKPTKGGSATVRRERYNGIDRNAVDLTDDS
ncbi:hypothetical protein Purlil1_11018 [Purpureocillium lilacinum]|uniref:Ubiquitin-like protease family profile domain-containing protein n=1 Tax=Purpureocillium lilacinum TaxID=33203 RepID=A0ABR0BKW3_PURLI|nr:hypothetical protein Purlil1_11018 [Purpureocillium lilacinum]